MRSVSFPRNWRDFARTTAGNLAVIASLSVAGIVLACGVAIDTGQTLRTKTALASAVDAAVLQAAAAGATDTNTVSDRVAQSLAENYDEERFGELVSTSITSSDDDVTLVATARYHTAFLSLVGIDHVDVPVTASATQGGMNLEVSLVLDVTGSMSSESIASLKLAAKSLANTVIQGDQTAYSTRVAVVPYHANVNLGSRATTARGAISPGTCTTPGCQYYTYETTQYSSVTMPIDTCVTERTGTYAYTDTSVELAPVGRHYATDWDPCKDSHEIQPLTTDIDQIETMIDAIESGWATAGQIGVAWGWYALSPNIGMWSGSELPATYDAANTAKIMVLMTDGTFNVAYCNGVQSYDYNQILYNIDCKATNGSPTEQAKKLCTAMKTAGVIVYTVAYNVTSTSTAGKMLSYCATDSTKAYVAGSTAALESAFATIANEVVTLRLSK